MAEGQSGASHGRLTDVEWDARLAEAHAKLRELDPELLDAINAEERGERRLTEEEQARLDAFLTGTGYLVSGRRVDPARIQVFRYDRGDDA